MTTGIGSSGSVSSNAGGRRTPGGKRTWRWASRFAVPASAISRRAVRSHSGLRRRRVSPVAAAHSAGARTSDRYPATAIGRPVAALSRGFAAVTDWTSRSAATVGKAGSGTSASRGEGARRRGEAGRDRELRGLGDRRFRLGAGQPRSHDDHQEQRRHGQPDDPQRAPDLVHGGSWRPAGRSSRARAGLGVRGRGRHPAGPDHAEVAIREEHPADESVTTRARRPPRAPARTRRARWGPRRRRWRRRPGPGGRCHRAR